MEQGGVGAVRGEQLIRVFGVSPYDQRLGSACSSVNLCGMKIIV